jgi:hypothetical protein
MFDVYVHVCVLVMITESIVVSHQSHYLLLIFMFPFVSSVSVSV